MTISYDTTGSAELLVRAQQALGISQQELADLIGRSRRSIIRWQRHGHVFLPDTCATLARALHPHDHALAAAWAARGGETLVSLGLERPAPPPLPAPALLPPVANAAPSADAERHQADSVVCAAAEAMQCPPQAIRPALIAALERVLAQGMSAEQALRGMRPLEKPAKRKDA